MKRIILLLTVLLLSNFGFTQCNCGINGEVAGQPAACGAGYYPVFKNALDGTGGANKHARQVWALHYRDEVSDLDQGESGNGIPAMVLVSSTISGCTVADQRCYAFSSDNCSNFNTTNTTDHCKFVWLVEQLRNGVGEFAIVIGGQSASNTLSTDAIQTKSNNRGQGCNAYFSPVIGDCGSGAGIPCVTFVSNDADSVVVDVTWAMPSTNAILFTKDSEDNLGTANACQYDTSHYNFNPADRSAALSTIITGWEIFYHQDSGTGPINGDKSLWTAIDDLDSTRVLVGGRYYSTDTSARVDIPTGGANYVFVAVAPVFDGSGGVPNLRDAIGNKSVNLINVTSRSSEPINPTPVTITSFTARYTDLQNVKIDWVTASETDAAGFILYRSIDKQNWTQVNSQIIPAKGQGGGGASYTYNDTVPKQRTYTKYYYKIEELSTNGERTAQAETETTK